MSYFTAVLAREGPKWFAHDIDVDSAGDLGELADGLRIVAADDDPVLLFLEREDAWWAVVRVDGDEDPRVFVSDARGVESSTYSFIVDLRDDSEDDEPLARVACSGDFDVLIDLGTSPDALREMCDDEVPPMEALATVAEAAGFAEALDSLR